MTGWTPQQHADHSRRIWAERRDGEVAERAAREEKRKTAFYKRISEQLTEAGYPVPPDVLRQFSEEHGL